MSEVKSPFSILKTKLEQAYTTCVLEIKPKILEYFALYMKVYDTIDKMNIINMSDITHASNAYYISKYSYSINNIIKILLENIDFDYIKISLTNCEIDMKMMLKYRDIDFDYSYDKLIELSKILPGEITTTAFANMRAKQLLENNEFMSLFNKLLECNEELCHGFEELFISNEHKMPCVYFTNENNKWRMSFYYTSMGIAEIYLLENYINQVVEF